MNPWASYKVEKQKLHGGIQNGRTKFTTVSHTSHVDSALEIVRRGEIRPGLVFDKSSLNDKRILVSWVSPNSWANGYRYGNIKFEIDFKALVSGRRAYWVEAITAYSPPAPRILITDQDRSKDLTAYDPENDEGPWLYDKTNAEHYFNGNYTLEFMFEGAISLQHMKSMDFVLHNPDMCSVSSSSPKSCEYLGKDGSFGGSRFVARCVAAGISLTPYANSFVISKSGNPNNTFEFAISPILRFLNLKKTVFTGKVLASDDLAEALANSILSAYSYGRIDQARQLAGLFETVGECEHAIAKEFGGVVALKTWKHLLQD